MFLLNALVETTFGSRCHLKTAAERHHGDEMARAGLDDAARARDKPGYSAKGGTVDRGCSGLG